MRIFTLQGSTLPTQDPAEVERLLTESPPGGMYTAWVDDTEHGALSLLVHSGRAWLSHLLPGGDPDRSSRGELPDDAGDIAFRLENGQVDHYPAAWTVPTEEAIRAFVLYFKTGRLADWITWVEDG